MIPHAVAIKIALINEPPASSMMSFVISFIRSPISIASAIARITFIFIGEVMIDANHRLAYPLVKRLEDIADGNSIREGDNRNGS